VLPWKPGDPANAASCRSIRLDRPDHGWLVDSEGRGATFDGVAWRPVARDGRREAGLVFPASGLALDRGRLYRTGVGSRALDGEVLGGASSDVLYGNAPAVFEEGGRWLASAAGVVAIDDGATRALGGQLS